MHKSNLQHTTPPASHLPAMKATIVSALSIFLLLIGRYNAAPTEATSPGTSASPETTSAGEADFKNGINILVVYAPYVI